MRICVNWRVYVKIWQLQHCPHRVISGFPAATPLQTHIIGKRLMMTGANRSTKKQNSLKSRIFAYYRIYIQTFCISHYDESRCGSCWRLICFSQSNYPSANLLTWTRLKPVVSKRLKLCKLSLTGSHLLHLKTTIQLVQPFVLIFSLVETKQRKKLFFLYHCCVINRDRL